MMRPRSDCQSYHRIRNRPSYLLCRLDEETIGEVCVSGHLPSPQEMAILPRARCLGAGAAPEEMLYFAEMAKRGGYW